MNSRLGCAQTLPLCFSLRITGVAENDWVRYPET